MSNPLSPEQIALILQEEQEKPTRTRGPRVDPTNDRSVQGWFRLAHHICTRDCPHRIDPLNPTAKVEYANSPIPANNADYFIKDDRAYHVIKLGAACWNESCLDHTRNKQTDRGANIVYEVKGQMICRYCYLGGYLL